jgi:hypothetical protein
MPKKSLRKGMLRTKSLRKEDHALLAPSPTHEKSESQSAVVVEVVCTICRRYRRVVCDPKALIMVMTPSLVLERKKRQVLRLELELLQEW